MPGLGISLLAGAARLLFQWDAKLQTPIDGPRPRISRSTICRAASGKIDLAGGSK
jgi:hypothetical protein